MTDKLRAAAKQALTALDTAYLEADHESAQYLSAIKSLCEALVENQLDDINVVDMAEHQEPIAWLYYENGEETFGAPDGYRPNDAVPLYIGTQPTKQPLTDEELEAAVASVSVYRGEYTHAIARAIEAAHGIK